MKARIEAGKVVKYSRLPKEFGKYVGGFDNADVSIHETEGFFDVVVPTYDPVTQVIYNLHFDDSYDSGDGIISSVFIYDVKAKTISETVAELKEQRINELKKLGYDKLQPTDWYIVRKAEKGTAIPSEIQTERDAIRTSIATKEGEINALTTKASILKYDINF